MSGLVIKLAPHERLLINGAVVENGDRRSRIHIVTPNANILRLKDAIHPKEAKTPVKRVCYIIQLILSGDAEPKQGKRQILNGIEQLSQVFKDHDSRNALALATAKTMTDDFYPALRALRLLIPREERAMALGSA